MSENHAFDSCNSNGGKSRLILHFDVNKTLIILDALTGKSMDVIMNEIIGERAWGVVEGGDSESVGSFRLVHPELVGTSPSDELISFVDYTQLVHPLQTPGPGKSLEFVTAHNHAARARRAAMKKSFTEPGSVGAQFRSAFTHAMSLMQRPDGSGPYVVLPSFFNLVRHLNETNRDYRIIFRTFGAEVQEVSEEYMLFERGLHPCFPLHQDFTKSNVTHQNCVMFRTGPGPDGTALAEGTLEMPALAAGVAALERLEGVKIYRGFGEIRDFFEEHSPTCLAVRDCFDWWNANGESSDSGKLLPLDTARREVHHVFFDDNARETRNILDVREAATGSALPFGSVNGKYIVRCDPYRAITEPDYFIKTLAACEENRCSCFER